MFYKVEINAADKIFTFRVINWQRNTCISKISVFFICFLCFREVEGRGAHCPETHSPSPTYLEKLHVAFIYFVHNFVKMIIVYLIYRASIMYNLIQRL